MPTLSATKQYSFAVPHGFPCCVIFALISALGISTYPTANHASASSGCNSGNAAIYDTSVSTVELPVAKTITPPAD